MSYVIAGLYEHWLLLDERSGTTASEIEKISEKDSNCQRLISVPGIGPLFSRKSFQGTFLMPGWV
jgi:transposase